MNNRVHAFLATIVLVAAFCLAWCSTPAPQRSENKSDREEQLAWRRNEHPAGSTKTIPRYPQADRHDSTISQEASNRGLHLLASDHRPEKGDASAPDSNRGQRGAAGQANSGQRPDGDSASRPTPSHLDQLDIPSICTADLPGLDFQSHQAALREVRDLIREQSGLYGEPRRDHPDPVSGKDSSASMSGPQPARTTSDSAPARGTPATWLAPDPTDTAAVENVPAARPSSSPTGDLPTASSPSPSEIEEMRSLLVHTPASRTNVNPLVLKGTHQPRSAPYNPHQQAGVEQNAAYRAAAANPNVDPHAEVFSRNAFPSATECKTCHEQIFREWSVSGHAYASISPMFQKFEQRINDLSQGTIGYFCLRCHAPVATTMELRRDQAIWDGPRVFREGVTCVACHRVVQAHGKDNGERRMEPGPLEAPVVGSSGGVGVELAKKYADYFKVKTDPQNKKPGHVIHRRAIQFDQLSKSTFCVSCHQVAVEPGIALEVVWNQYRASPAYRQGITCQDCHMGRVPGMAEGYSVGPVAVIDGKQVSPDRKHSNHQFYGPGYSIAHPGVFPHNPDADKWTFNEWLQFDWRSGWGTEAFEAALRQGQVGGYFPPIWSEPDDRMDAREIIDANLKLLAYKRDLRRQVMENGAKIEGPYFAAPPQRGQPLKFHYVVRNISTGHNMPSGSLGAQPQLWLNVVLIGPQGNRLWESGYLDSIGDLADLHSADVLARRVPLDTQLFNLQTKFLTTNVKGTDREMYLPINVDIDQLPFIRPDTRPNTVMNHPPFIRMEAHSIPATGSRKAKYKIPAHLLSEPGCYRLSVRMRSRAEPIYFMKFVNATPEMIRSMNEGILDVHTFSKTFTVR